jgi:GH24 family phage-related lysozyme (muramidase)
MSASTALKCAIAIIKEWEGFKENAYPDPLTKREPITIGWGSTRKLDGSKWKLGDRITKEEADALLLHQLQFDYIPPLARIPGWETFNPHQQGALISFAYNSGPNFYGNEKEFETITRVLRDRTFEKKKIESTFLLYCNPGTNVEKGLRKRRQQEAKLFLTPYTQDPVSVPVTPMNAPAPAIFRTRVQTFLKKDPHSAKDLPPERKIELPEDIFLRAIAFQMQGKHYKVTLNTQTIAWERQGLTRTITVSAGEWYLYGTPESPTPHVELYTAGATGKVAVLQNNSPPSAAVAQTPPPLVTFRMNLPDKAQDALVTGTLDIVGTKEPHQLTVTSGARRCQYRGSTHLKGKGPLPSCQELGIDNYWILTEQLPRFQTKGIEGYAFHIIPDPVTIRRVKRGEFMAHNDTNRSTAPGSSGCIVFIFDRGWEVFLNCMKQFRDRGIKKVPLIVIYT